MGFLKKNTCSRKSRGEKNIYYTDIYAILMPTSTFLSGNGATCQIRTDDLMITNQLL